jgi:hypothetical protein
VLSVPEPIKVGDLIPLVGISSRVGPNTADPARHVAMRWLERRGGHPETGFANPCYACVDFTHVLQVRAGEIYGTEVSAEFNRKFVAAEKFQTLVATMNAWTRRK